MRHFRQGALVALLALLGPAFSQAQQLPLEDAFPATPEIGPAIEAGLAAARSANQLPATAYGFDLENRLQHQVHSARLSVLRDLKAQVAAWTKATAQAKKGKKRKRRKKGPAPGADGVLRWPVVPGDAVLSGTWGLDLIPGRHGVEDREAWLERVNTDLDVLGAGLPGMRDPARRPAVTFRTRCLLALRAGLEGKDPAAVARVVRTYREWMLQGEADGTELPPYPAEDMDRLRASCAARWVPELDEAALASLEEELLEVTAELNAQGREPTRLPDLEAHRRKARLSYLVGGTRFRHGRLKELEIQLEQRRETEELLALALKSGATSKVAEFERGLSQLYASLRAGVATTYRHHDGNPSAGDLDVFLTGVPTGTVNRSGSFTALGAWIFDACIAWKGAEEADKEGWMDLHRDVQAVLEAMRAGDRERAEALVDERRLWILEG